ncbi:hypothetical protein NBH00_16950 [Paraconexibacter antarcticus]|uniref:Uncharacterized protein n=1 Tax=Paraconexibacter antarcticus TaxID=2949664 RepID=A0ABY5DN29_9ACTN|nr:hypothetical protein [Paraconexibacter antarcticus]UTI63041.1 hypothetical protein NBH00_16950 [Paraconexibacter antarcticus]
MPVIPRHRGPGATGGDGARCPTAGSVLVDLLLGVIVAICTGTALLLLGAVVVLAVSTSALLLSGEQGEATAERPSEPIAPEGSTGRRDRTPRRR